MDFNLMLIKFEINQALVRLIFSALLYFHSEGRHYTCDSTCSRAIEYLEFTIPVLNKIRCLTLKPLSYSMDVIMNPIIET